MSDVFLLNIDSPNLNFNEWRSFF